MKRFLISLLALCAVVPCFPQEVTKSMPLFYGQLKESLTYPMAWGNASTRNFRRWQKQGRAKVLECMSPAPPMADGWDMEIVDSEQRSGYTAHKIFFNVSAWSRVPAYLLVPDASTGSATASTDAALDGEGTRFPAVLALHDHGAHFTIGKEKMVRPFGVSDELKADADRWSYDCYDGQYVGDYLARHGYVVLAVDALLWGDRGRAEGPDYDAQQALNANLQQMGMSLGSYIAWDDLRSVSFLRSLPQVDAKRIAVVGHSMGAHRAWLTAALSDDVKACVAVCWMNTTDSLMTLTNNQNKGGSAYAMLIPGLRNYLDYPHVASLACPKPMLFLNGTNDKLFPVDGVRDAYDTMRAVWHDRHADDAFQAELVDGPHYFSRSMQQRALSFLDEQLKNPSIRESDSPSVHQSDYPNPILPTDFSDPDVIRVGDRYYMTCSEFHYMGMHIMESADLVHWRTIAHVYDSIPLPGYGSMQRYGQGTWAPSLRYHDGKYWIFVCTPNDGLFMTTAERPEGPWAPLHCVKAVERWEDPCPLWDDDGNAYLGHSVLGAGPIIVHRMAPDGSRLLDDGKVVYTGPVAEGTKFHKMDGWYYLSIPEGGVGTGWQMVLRSKNIYGPYEGKRVLEQGTTAVNGPHQGALVDSPDGRWWFFHFQDTDPLGRIVHLQPVVWQDGFPVIGHDNDGNGVGEPVAYPQPLPKGGELGAVSPSLGVALPRSTGEPRGGAKTIEGFRVGSLVGSWVGSQVDSFTNLLWQWNHNPHPAFIRLTADTLALRPQPAERVRDAVNQYTLKTYGPHNRATVTLHVGAMAVGQRAGIESLGRHFVGFGVEMRAVDGTVQPYLYTEHDGTVTYHGRLHGDAVTLVLDADNASNSHCFAYTTDGTALRWTGPVFRQHTGDWKGSRIGLYAYQTGTTATGEAQFSNILFE